MKKVSESPPTWILPRISLPVRIVELLWATGKFESKGAIRRLIKQGAIKIKGGPI